MWAIEVYVYASRDLGTEPHLLFPFLQAAGGPRTENGRIYIRMLHVSVYRIVCIVFVCVPGRCEYVFSSRLAFSERARGRARVSGTRQ